MSEDKVRQITEDDLKGLDVLEGRLNACREPMYVSTEVNGQRMSLGESKYRTILMAAHFNDELLADCVRAIIDTDEETTEEVEEVVRAAEALETADYGARQINLGNISGGAELIGTGLKSMDGEKIPVKAGVLAKGMEKFLGIQAKRFSKQFED